MITRIVTTLAATAMLVGVSAPAFAQGVDHGPYVRFELGGAFDASGDAYWRPPGFPADPQVFFDLSHDNGYFASAAVGHQWSDQFRGDISVSLFGKTDFSGPWSHTVPATAGPHADITGGDVKTTAIMANGYWMPFATGDSAAITPFLTAGIGMANNRVGDWTRTLATAPRVTRTFEGGSNNDLAWSLGFGVTGSLGSANGSPVLFEATYRYFDLGTAMGSGTPLPGNGASTPVTPLTFDNRDHVVSLGIRIPLGGN